MKLMPILAVCGMVLATTIPAAIAQEADVSFFVTSQGPGDGANLGGLDGADAHCQQLADAARVGGKTWRAYLSTSTADARDRIGTGPWHNAAGELIAEDLDALHSEDNNHQRAVEEVRDRLFVAASQPLRAGERGQSH